MLFRSNERVSALIDWDKACLAPRAWEMLRTLEYVFNLDGPRCQIFLDAYREVMAVSMEELTLAAQAYEWIQANNLWAYRSFYLEHNQRVRHLLHPSFTPFTTRWSEVAHLLCE